MAYQPMQHQQPKAQTPLDRLSELGKFVIDTAVVGYYFFYFLLKFITSLEPPATADRQMVGLRGFGLLHLIRSRPDYSTEPQRPLAIDDKPHCCLHGVTGHEHNHTHATAAPTAAGAGAGSMPARYSPGGWRVGSPTPSAGGPSWRASPAPSSLVRPVSESRTSTYVFQVGGIPQHKTASAAGGGSWPAPDEQQPGSSKQQSGGMLSGIKSGVWTVASKLNPMNAVTYVRDTVKQVTLPSIPMPGRGGAAKDTSTPPVAQQFSPVPPPSTKPIAAGWTSEAKIEPSAPWRVTTVVTDKTSSVPAPPPPPAAHQMPSTARSEAARVVTDALQDLPHQREPTYPSAFGGGGGASQSHMQRSTFTASSTQDYSTAFSSYHQPPPPPQQQFHTLQPLHISSPPPTDSMSHHTLPKREIRTETGSSMSPPQRPQTKLRILSQELHESVIPAAPPPIPPRSPVASGTHTTTTTHMFATRSGEIADAAPRFEMFSAQQQERDDTSQQQPSLDLFAPEPYHAAQQVQSLSRNWPPPSNASIAMYEKDHYQLIGQRQMETWGTTADSGTTVTETQSVVPPAPPPPPPHRSTRTPDPPAPPAPTSMYQDQLDEQVAPPRKYRSQSEHRTTYNIRQRQEAEQQQRAAEAESIEVDTDFSRHVRNPQGDVLDWQRSTQQYGDKGGVTTTMFGPEKSREFSRLLLEAEQTGGSGKGIRMFSKRRERSDQWVVESPAKREEVVDSVMDAAARHKEEYQRHLHQTAPFPVSSADYDIPPSVPLPEPQLSLNTTVNQTYSSTSSASGRLFSPLSQSTAPSSGLFSPSSFNVTPKDWKSFSQEYSSRY